MLLVHALLPIALLITVRTHVRSDAACRYLSLLLEEICGTIAAQGQTFAICCMRRARLHEVMRRFGQACTES